MPEYVTADADGFSVTSNTATAEDMAANLAPPAEPAVADPTDAEPEAVAEESEATKAARTLAAQRKKGDPAKDPAAKKQSIQAQIDAETKRKHDAKREADAEAARVADLKRQREELERQPAAKQLEPEKPKEPAFYTRPKPSVDQIGSTYETYEDYIDDLTDWKADERDAKRSIQAQRDAAERTQRDVFTKAQERITAFRKDHDDYDAVVNAAYVPPGSPAADAIGLHLAHSEMGPALAYALGKDPAELARIAGLPPAFAVAALGRLEERLDAQTRTEAASSGPAPSAPARTKANPPIKPVGGSPVASDDGEVPDDLPFEEHVKRMNALDARSARRR